MQTILRPRWRAGAFLLGTLALAGCANLSHDAGFGDVAQWVQQRAGGQTRWARNEEDGGAIRKEVERLLSQPLSADSAVIVALMNNQGLQAAYDELGIAEADVVQAGRLPNPRLSYLRASHDGAYKVETTFTFNILALFTVPMATEIEKRRFEQVKRRAALQAINVASDTRRAFYAAVAARQTASYAEQVRESAEAGSELARRMAAAGNFSRLQQSREQAFLSEAIVQVDRTRQDAFGRREGLTRLLGLESPSQFKLPERLPDLPKAADDLQDVEQQALDGRLDVAAARLDLEGLAKSLGLTRTTRFVNAIEFGPAWATESPEPRKKGFELSLEVPLFDWGGARVARAEAVYLQGVHRLTALANEARSEVRERHSAYKTAFGTARHYRDDIVPLRKAISDEMLLRYNGMLSSVFELLADAREQAASVNAAIEAQRDFWIAETELRAALAGASMTKPGESTARFNH